MIKTKKQMFIVIAIFAFIIIIGGTTYAWFSYRRESVNQTLIAGDIYLKLEEGNDTISLTNIFPETKEEARARNDNYLTFEINGINESNKTIYYEIDLNHGTEKNSPYERFNDEDLRFDLVELDSNGDEVRYLLSNVGFDTLDNKKIWVDEVTAGSSTEVSKKYKLRMWLSDEVIISDSDPNRDYLAVGYNNHYASIKVSVIGDFNEKYFGYQKVRMAILNKEASGETCNNITYEEDGIIYLSGTDDCVDMNYVWYSGKLWRITAIYPDGAMKLVTQNNITTLSFNENGNVNFYTDDNNKSYVYQWLNEDFYDTLYNHNMVIDSSKTWNATANSSGTTKPATTSMVTASVGLLNNRDYYNSYRCIESNDSNCSRNVAGSSSRGYLEINYNWMLLNPYNSTHVWSVQDNGLSHYLETFRDIGIRPSIYIKSTLDFVGDGTSSNPYRIVGDKEVGKENELINTRLSGEYIKLKNGSSEQVFRIIDVENNKTKIIAMDYADSTNRQFSTNTGASNVIWGSGATTGENTWYTYLNTPTTGYFDTLKSTYGELFDSGTYYIGKLESGIDVNNNYKTVICSVITETTKTCPKISYSGEFNIGLPRFGEMFAAQQTFGNNSAKSMWLINYYSSAAVWIITVPNVCGSNIVTSTGNIRPTLHLKSTVKILSGSGTEQDPYVVGL
jgi:hypothetical protein